MVYYGTNTVEHIVIHPAGYSEDKHAIEMIKHSDVPAFTVTYCCDPTWRYDFYMDNNSDYERVKFNIMEQIFECEDIDELLIVLGELFEVGFKDMLVKHECDCDGSCENCTCND